MPKNLHFEIKSEDIQEILLSWVYIWIKEEKFGVF